MPKRLFLPFITLLTAVSLLSGCASDAQQQATPTPIPRPPVPTKPTYEVQRGDITTLIQFSGRIRPIIEEALFFRADGRVRNVYVKSGDSVTAGQLLADLENIQELESQQALDDLRIQRAQINLEIAQLNLELARAAEDSPQNDILVAIKENEVRLAQLAVDEISLGAENRLAAIEAAKILAPFDGQIITVAISPGNTIAAFGSGLVIADVADLEVSGTVDREEAEDLDAGMTAVIGRLNRPGETLSGTIRQLPFESGNPNDSSIRVTLDQAPAEVGLELNDRVQVTITLENKEDVLWLPPQAIRVFEGRRFVVVKDGEAEQRIDVRLGLQSSERVEIVEGLTEGQIVVGL